MAHHLSAKNSIKKIKKRTFINKSRKSKIKTYIKQVLKAVQDSSLKSQELSKEYFIRAQSEIMKGVVKSIIKKGTASRIISRLSKKLKF